MKERMVEQVYVLFETSSKTCLSLFDVSLLDDGHYRLEMTDPFLLADEDVAVGYGDIVQLTPLEDTSRYGHLEHRAMQFCGIVKTEYKHFCWLLPNEIFESPRFARFTDSVLKEGGVWERIMGGVLVMSLPLASTFEPEGALDGEDVTES